MQVKGFQIPPRLRGNYLIEQNHDDTLCTTDRKQSDGTDKVPTLFHLEITLERDKSISNFSFNFLKSFYD